MTQPAPFPDRKAGFARLRQLAQRPDGDKITPLFAADPKRAERYTVSFEDLVLDYSKTAIDDTAWDALFGLAETAGFEAFRKRLFAGEQVNATEHRAAMHMALRAPRDSGLKAIMPRGTEDAAVMAANERDKMHAFCTAVHSGQIRGATGQPFTDVVTIGIGGSDLGPKVATEALTISRTDQKLRPHFISNVDGHGFLDVVKDLDPARTLVLVASKTFTTLETAMNAAAARAWVAGKLGEKAIADHFAALSTNMEAVKKFGMNPERVFAFQDWVGGRYSLWSPVGLVIPLAVGWEKFQQMLDGAWAMDQHFRDAPLRQNVPFLMGLTGIWNTNALGCGTLCILAYDDRLRRLPAHLQQVEMESNGKHVMLDGEPTGWDTCPIIFGEPGTNAQHSFMQLVHQGTRKVPVDFILAANPDHDRPDAHRALAANAFAQAEALMVGRHEEAIREEMKAHGDSPAEVDAITPQRVAVGERPSNTILFDRLTPYALGRLIALYEHKVAVQGCLWGIDSFDQWGVELGKHLATGILPELTPGAAVGEHDSSTTALIHRFRTMRGES
jgi:glucose-6-phosphate isomerase